MFNKATLRRGNPLRFLLLIRLINICVESKRAEWRPSSGLFLTHMLCLFYSALRFFELQCDKQIDPGVDSTDVGGLTSSVTKTTPDTLKHQSKLLALTEEHIYSPSVSQRFAQTIHCTFFESFRKTHQLIFINEYIEVEKTYRRRTATTKLINHTMTEWGKRS